MTPLVATHAFAALTAVMLGGWQLFTPKGTTAHRFTGRVWVGLMLFVAVSSFWIREIRHGEFSALHLLSVVTLATVTAGLVAAMRGNILAHRGNMVGSWIGLTIAGLVAAAVPARALPTFVLDRPGSAALALALVATTTAAVIAAGRGLSSRLSSPNSA